MDLGNKPALLAYSFPKVHKSRGLFKTGRLPRLEKSPCPLRTLRHQNHPIQSKQSERSETYISTTMAYPLGPLSIYMSTLFTVSVCPPGWLQLRGFLGFMSTSAGRLFAYLPSPAHFTRRTPYISFTTSAMAPNHSIGLHTIVPH